MALILSALAGCLGDSGDEIPPEDKAPDDDLDEEEENGGQRIFNVDDMNLSSFRFPLEASLHEAMWVNGSFQPQETGIGGGFVTGAFVKEIDLGELVPAGVPTHMEVVVTMDAETVPFVGPTGRALPMNNGTTWYESQWREPEPGRFEMNGVLNRDADGTFGIRLEAYTSGPDAPPEMDYSVYALATARPDVVPPGVPVALELAANETIVFDAHGDTRSELLVYGPDDALVDRRIISGPEPWAVPLGAGGEYVVLSVHGSAGLQISRTDDETGVLRALHLERHQGEPHEISPSTPVSWTFALDERPLRVLLSLVGPADEPWVCSGPITLGLSSPQGAILDHSLECPAPTNVPFMFDESWILGPDIGDRRMVPGSYEASVEPDLWYGYEVRHVVEHYRR